MPSLLPDAFELRPTPSLADGPAAMPIGLPDLPGLNMRRDDDKRDHGLWRERMLEHRFWLEAPPPDEPTTYSVIVPLDALFELRTEAVLSFWRAINGRNSDAWRHVLPPQTRDRHILILRALDARQTGASYRVVAEALLGFRGRSKSDWEVSPLKNQARRLVADGRFYVSGGYRELLHYPVRLTRRD